MNIPVLRKWQSEMIGLVKEQWLTDRGFKALIAACPGSGKTLASSVLALEKLKDGTVTLVLVIAPTINIKVQWKAQFKKLGVDAHDSASNEAMRNRRDRQERMVGGYDAICLTYAQLAKDKDLFVELARREKTLLIADEVHHADDQEVYGVALSGVAEHAVLKLALSGTPFNSSGGALAMCPSEEITTDEGRVVRKATPLYTYSYGQAIQDIACRVVEFIKVYGVGKSTYKSLANNTTFQKIVDLSKQNKTDSIGALLDPDGDFLKSMLEDGLKALQDIQRTDRRAAMLVVAKDKEHGARIAHLLGQQCKANKEWRSFSILEIYNDTDNAHARIEALEKDRTDIVITVRMISEGVDVKRLRVGVYATDYRTRMFFVQFVGRFVRWESRLDGTQHGRVIVPAHVDLLIFAREIETMVDRALIAGDESGGDGPKEPKNEYLGTDTQRTADGIICRGKESEDRFLAELFLQKHPSLRGVLREDQAIQAAKDENLKGASHSADEVPNEPDWWQKNAQMVRAIVRLMKMNGDNDDRTYQRVNSAANKHVGIPKVDELVAPATMKKRHAFLKSWFDAVRNDQEFNYGY